MVFSTVLALTAGAVASSIGVNTHLDFQNSAYRNLAVTEAAIQYLGVGSLRDSAQMPGDLITWPMVATATGAKFDDYMGEGSRAQDTADLAMVTPLAAQGILNAIEGGNENDDAYAVRQGNSIAWTAKFQRDVYTLGHMLGLPVVNMSFGAGWNAQNGAQGDYGKVGDLSRYCDYANAHSYPNVGSTPGATIRRMNVNAKLAAKSRPVMTTEMGWNTPKFSRRDAARFALDAVFDAVSTGNAKIYFYALFDDQSGRYGLMNADGTRRPAGAALHNLSAILKDPGIAQTGSLRFSLDGAANDQTLLMEKSGGAFELAVWNETDAAHMATLTLAVPAYAIRVYDPMTRATAIRAISHADAIAFQVPDHPVIVEIVPTGASR